MGVKLNFFNVILVILFVIGVVISGFLLYNLPDNLLKQTLVLEIQDMKSITPVLSKINIAVGATLLIGLATIIVLLFSRSGESDMMLETSGIKNNDKVGGSGNQNFGSDEKEEDNVDVQDFEKLLSEKLSLEELSTKSLTHLCKKIEASQAALYFTNKTKGQRLLELKGSYAYILPDSQVLTYEFGEGLVGQAAKTGKTAHIKEVPKGYIKIFSGLGKSEPGEVLIVPLKNGEEIIAVAEIATFKPLSKRDIKLAERSCSLLAKHLAKSKPAKTAEKEDNKS